MMKQCPQVILADELNGNWPQAGYRDGRFCYARPLSVDGVLTRIRLAWGVFTGKYDALKWGLDQ